MGKLQDSFNSFKRTTNWPCRTGLGKLFVKWKTNNNKTPKLNRVLNIRVVPSADKMGSPSKGLSIRMEHTGLVEGRTKTSQYEQM